MGALRHATSRAERPVVVVATSQCLRGTVDHTGYATGAALRDAGVRSAHDMTTEAALAKLYYLIRCGHGPEEIARLVERDLVGELTEPPA